MTLVEGQPSLFDHPALDRFHPAVRAWFTARFPDGPTPPQLGGWPAIAAGEDTLIARLMAHAGFASHSAARGMGQGAYLPLEQVLADPPELVLAAGSERMLTHPALRGLAGVRYERLDPSLLFCGGPTVVRAVERLAELRTGMPLPLAGGARGGPVDSVRTDPPPPPPASGRGAL